MLKLNVKLDVQRMQAAHRDAKREVRKAASRAINRAADTAATTAGRAISKATRIPVRKVRERISVKGSTPDRLIAEVTAHPYAPNLAAFRPTENNTGVAATAWEGRKTYKHAFINPKTGKVVSRQTDARLPLKGLKGPSVPKTFVKEEITKQMDSAASARFSSEFDREIARRLKG